MPFGYQYCNQIDYHFAKTQGLSQYSAACIAVLLRIAIDTLILATVIETLTYRALNSLKAWIKSAQRLGLCSNHFCCAPHLLLKLDFFAGY